MRPINLLPREARAEVRARRKVFLWLLLGVGYLVILGGLVLWQQGKVGDAEDEVDDQQVVIDQLNAEIATLADLQTIKDSFDRRVGNLQLILERDLAWGRVLNDLGRLIPPRVWLESFSGAVDPASAETLGQIQVSGTAFDYPDVGSWLRSLDSTTFPGVAQTWVSTASSSQIGEIDVVSFSSSTTLTADALSGRFERLVPELP